MEGQIVFSYCSDDQLIDDSRQRYLLAGVIEAGLNVRVVGDLCSLATEKDSCLLELAASSDVMIVSPYSKRSVCWLIDFAGGKLAENAATVDLQKLNDAEVFQQVCERVDIAISDAAMARADELVAPYAAQAEWRPWFPTLDYNCCTSCGQCLGFCLFGVYEKKGDKIVVANPANCKNNCPACSRICPKGAIIFPKFQGAPIDGREVEATGEAVAIDVKGLVDADVMSALRKRSATPDGQKQIADAMKKFSNDKPDESQDDEPACKGECDCDCKRKEADDE